MRIDDLYTLFRQHPRVSTDSRNCSPDSIFFALKGDKFDGNEYIPQVLENGAVYAVGDSDTLPDDPRILRVDDVLTTLQELAAYHRRQWGRSIIGITGSNGKTTTKELLAATLGRKFKVLFTEGNLNNHIGVPLTLLRLSDEHEVAVVEMGANHPGEIADLCHIADPNYGLITNVGRAHLEGFGSFEGVIQTKTELYRYLDERGRKAFANKDNTILSERCPALERIWYGTTDDCFVWGETLRSIPTLAVLWKGQDSPKEHIVDTHLVGGYNFENVMAAVAVASWLGVDAQDINLALENYQPTNNRSQTIRTEKNQLIVDAYNANPSSMDAALTNFLTLEESPKAVILGEMGELGTYRCEEHRKIADKIRTADIAKVILVGSAFADCIDSLNDWLLFPSTDRLVEYLEVNPVTGYTILIKGSRANRLERVVSLL